ncbi:hypothetical protein CLOM_g11801 [Closterium sp. NIES-68]|nr:hypothetical protein CLOM_g11801 [Closterium sp. NIES-68]
MLFHAAGAEGSRPTFFEMAAADYLPASLKAAALYALGVLAQHRPSLHRVLDYSDELTAAALLLLEWHSLKTHGASFGESMYGLRRISTVPRRPPPSQAAARAGGAARGAAGGAEGAGRGEGAAGGQEGGAVSQGMSGKQRALSLLFLVLLPYIRTKLHTLFAARQRQRQARALWVGEEEGGDEGWGETGEGGWGMSRAGEDADPGQADGHMDEYGGVSGGVGRGNSDISPSSLDSAGSVGDGMRGGGFRGDGLSRGETGEGIASEEGRAVGGGGAEGGGAEGHEARGVGGEGQTGGQGGWVVTGGAAARGSVVSRHGGGSSSRRWRQVLRLLRSVQRRVVQGAAAAYPWLQAPYEGLNLLYQLLYVMDATPYYSPILHLLSLSLRRATPQELAEASSSVSVRRQREFELLPGPPALRAMQAALLKALYFAMDYAQTSVIAAVFAFKMAEWWFQTGEQKLSAPTVYPPPPPPPPPKVAPAGIPVPADRSLCPLCLCRRTNPTAPATSGFIFCYPCIFAYVDKFGRCPITHHPTNVDQLRRLFPDA